MSRIIKAREVKETLESEADIYWSEDGKIDKDDFKHIMDQVQWEVKRPIIEFRFRDIPELLRWVAICLFIVLEIVLINKFS